MDGRQTERGNQVAAAGAGASRRFLEFFTANIRNRNTRTAYAQAVGNFFRWCEVRGLRELAHLEPVHVAAYVEQLGSSRMPLQASSSIWPRCACWPQCIIGTRLYGSARRGALNGALSGAVRGDNPRDRWLADIIEARHLGACLPTRKHGLGDFARFLSSSLGRRPPIRPSARACARPAEVRSRIIARSNSAKAPTICIIIRPRASSCRCLGQQRKPAPAASILSMSAAGP